MILAAGEATRFGAVKVLAPLRGKALLQHVIDAAAEAELAEIVLVLGSAAAQVAAGVRLPAGRVAVNANPQAGLSGSVRIGLAALGDETDAAVILLGDQPRVRPNVITRLLAASEETERPIVVPRYAAGGGPNPLVIRRIAWPLADRLGGDRGLGPLIARRPDLVHHVLVEGDNPDVDTHEDLEALERGPGR